MTLLFKKTREKDSSFSAWSTWWLYRRFRL